MITINVVFTTISVILIACATWCAVRITRARRTIEKAAGFVRWAQCTMITVTDHTGNLYARTVMELYTESTDGHADRLWTGPIGVAVWTGDPETIATYRKESTL